MLAESCHQTRQQVFLLSFNQVVDQASHIVEAHTSPLSAGRQSQPTSHVTFPESWIAHQDHWLVIVDIDPASQLQNTRFGNGWDAAPVKIRQIFEDGEAGFKDRSFNA